MLQHLPAYKGPDVYNRGKDVEDQAFFYVAELEQGIREWVGAVYHPTKHSGLCIPKVPGASFCPTELFEIGLAKTGGLLLPASRDLAYQFLQVPWRTIQHYGVEAGVEPAPKHPLRAWRRARRQVADLHRHPRRAPGVLPRPVDQTMASAGVGARPSPAPALHQPFSQDAVNYAKQIALRTNSHVDPLRAVWWGDAFPDSDIGWFTR